MRILFIEFTCDGTVGGSHTCLYNLVKNLDRKKYQVGVVFFQPNLYVDKLNMIGIPVHVINRQPFTQGNVLIRKIKNWYRLVYKHKRKLQKVLQENNTELVVLNNTIAYSSEIITICSKLNMPVICYERGYLRYTKKDINNSSKLYASIPVSNAVKCNMEKQKLLSKLHVIYDGLDVSGLSVTSNTKEKPDIKLTIGIPENSVVVGIVGNVREWKGQEYFARAFMLLAEKYQNLYGLVVGGYGKEDMSYVERIKRISQTSEAGVRLKLLGFRDDIPDLLGILDVFVHASITPEPFGMVILEAMLCKVPVIATNFGGPMEILGNGDFGILVPPSDPQAIVEGVEKYLNDTSFRDEVVSRAHERVIEKFNLRYTVAQAERLFNNVIGSSGTSERE